MDKELIERLTMHMVDESDRRGRPCLRDCLADNRDVIEWFIALVAAECATVSDGRADGGARP